MRARKRIEELIALYRIEPSLKDVYVEGAVDKHMLAWFLAKRGRQDITVYEIDSVDIPEVVLKRHSLPTSSSRANVLALSCELEAATEIRASVLCIADRDFEDHYPSVSVNRFLRFTDFCALESYLIEAPVFEKFFAVSLGGGMPAEPSFVLRQITGVLRDMFLFRGANRSLGWGMLWLRPRGYLNIGRDSISFDAEAFMRAYLLKNGRWASREAFMAEVEALRASLALDPKLCVHGHDFVEVMQLVAKKLKSKRHWGDVDFFAGAFRGCLESQDLAAYPMFQTLVSL